MKPALIAVLTVLLPALTLATPAQAELLSRQGLDSREAYYERVTRLGERLREDIQAGASRETIRDLAVTLSAALTDLGFSEAGARRGMVVPPEDAALRPGAAPSNSDAVEPGAPVPIAEVPYAWFVDRLDRAREQARTIVTRLDEGDAPDAEIAEAAAAVGTLVDEMRRPPTR